MNKTETEYVVTLYGPKDDTQRENGPPEGKNPFELFDYRASLGLLNEEQLERFLVDGKFSAHRTKPLCPCCPHLFVVESLQEINKDSQDYQATLRYANMKEVRVHATSCKKKGAIVQEIEWLKGLAASIRGEVDDGKSSLEDVQPQGENSVPIPAGPTPTNDERDKRIYAIAVEHPELTWGEVANRVNAEFLGEQLDGESAPKAAGRYAKKHELKPVPKRKLGRKPGRKNKSNSD